MWNEQNWTLVAMPVSSTRAQWDEGLRTVRQFNDLLRVLPPMPEESPQAVGAQAALRSAAPSRPLAPAGRAELPPGRAQQDVSGLLGSDVQAGRRAPEPMRRPPPTGRNGHQATNYQR
jgi:hypothetical protein